jgi:hypothetical protein
LGHTIAYSLINTRQIQSNTPVCLIIHLFCRSCEPEIVFVLIWTIAEQFHVHKSYKCVNQHCRALEILCQSHIDLAVQRFDRFYKKESYA